MSPNYDNIPVDPSGNQIPILPSDMLFDMHQKFHKDMLEDDIQSDVLGSYTGYSLIDDEPEQDADDL